MAVMWGCGGLCAVDLVDCLLLMLASMHSSIALFVFNRPLHLEQCLLALRANDGAEHSRLIVFSDGPRGEEDREGIKKVRDLTRSITGFRSVELVERPENMGLARSIISGVTEVLQRSESLIVLEDDLVTSPFFLRYMNDALSRYRDDPRVASIHGYVYPVKEKLPETFFLRGADCWGWATWGRAWEQFRASGEDLLRDLEAKQLTHSFDFDGACSYTQMLRDQIAGKNNSWAIRWHASAFIANMLTLYPGRSLINNIGLDGSGTHCGVSDDYFTVSSRVPVKVEPVPVVESAMARRSIVKYFRDAAETRRPHSLWAKVLYRIGWY
jgi:hypothetical protein